MGIAQDNKEKERDKDKERNRPCDLTGAFIASRPSTTCKMTYATAINVAEREGLNIHVEELIMICLDSWETEYTMRFKEVDKIVYEGELL